MLLKVKRIIFSLHSSHNLLNYCCSSSSIQQQKQVREKALLSMHVINTIIKRPTFQKLQQPYLQKPQQPLKIDLQQPSLVDQILEGIQNDKDSSSESKREISSLFREGIKIDNDVFRQSRIQRGSIIASKQSDELQKNFVFYPTNLVTSQLFKKIRNLSTSKKILIGHYGISKTVSVSLFWKLTRYIDEYRFQKVQKITDEKLYKLPKIVYWNIGMEDTLSDVEDLILKQCPEINSLPQAQKFGEKSVKLQYLYSKINSNIKCYLVIDQINNLASLLRTLEALKEKQKNQDLDEDEKQLFLSIKKIIGRMKLILQKILPSFHGVLYLSSMGIQDSFLQEFDLANDFKHSKAQKQLVSYSTQIFEPQNMLELINYFLFQFEQRIFRSNSMGNLDSKIKAEIRNQCFKYLSDDTKKLSFFFTPLDIRLQMERTQASHTQRLKNLSSQDLVKQISQIFRDIIDESTEKYRKILQKSFLKKDDKDDQRKNLMLSLSNQCRKIALKQLESRERIAKRSDTDKNQSQELNSQHAKRKEHKSFVPQKIKIHQLDLSSSLINKYLDKRLFYYQEDLKQITLQLPAHLVVKVLEPLIAENLEFYLKFSQQWLAKNHKKDQFGSIIENMFILALTKGNMDVEVNFKSAFGQYETILFNNIKKNAYWFKAIPQYQFKKTKTQIEKAKQEQKQENKKSSSVLISQKNEEQNSIQSATPASKSSNKNKAKLKNEKQREELHELKLNTDIRRKREFRFIDTIISSFEEMVKNSEQNTVCLPLSWQGSYIKDQGKILEKIDEKSKCIDLILLSHRKGHFEICAIDVTTSQGMVKQKIKKFIEQFIAFQDRAKQTITLTLENGNKLEAPVKLSYFVFCPKPQIPNLKKDLNDQFGDYLKFDSLQGSSVVNVTELEDSSQSLLKKIGYIDLGNEVNFRNKNNKQVLTFGHALTEFNKKKDESEQLRKQIKQINK